MMLLKKIIIMAIFLGGLTAVLSAQISLPDQPKTTPPPDNTKPTTPTPEPYTDDEFPQWLKDLRRAEIIFFGSLPFSFLFAFEGVEIGRYIASGQDPLYRPWPFRDAAAPPYTPEEQLWIVGSAVVISGIVALVDFIINQAVRARAPTQQ